MEDDSVPALLPLSVLELAPAPLLEPVPALVPLLEPAPALLPLPAPADTIDLLYNKMILNSSLLAAIGNLKSNGFTNASIPLLILSVMTTYNAYSAATPAHTLTTDDVQVLLERVYSYLVEKYNLIDMPERLAMYMLFDASLKLCLATPNVKQEVTSCLKFFRCAK